MWGRNRRLASAMLSPVRLGGAMSVASTRGRRDLTRRRAQHLPECRLDWPSCCATSGPGTPSWSSRWTGAAGPCPDDPAIETLIPLGAAPVAARVTGSVRHFASRYWGGACHSVMPRSASISAMCPSRRIRSRPARLALVRRPSTAAVMSATGTTTNHSRIRQHASRNHAPALTTGRFHHRPAWRIWVAHVRPAAVA
jgi:hypothetical protein